MDCRERVRPLEPFAGNGFGIQALSIQSVLGLLTRKAEQSKERWLLFESQGKLKYVKGSVLTTRAWLLLAAACLLVAGGAFNFAQRAKQQTPPTDGVTWTDTREGIVAESVLSNSAAAKAHIVTGDRIIAISLTGQEKGEEVTRAKDIQLYLNSARVAGEIHYLIERPSHPAENRYYWADIDRLDALTHWSPAAIYVNLVGLVSLLVGFFVLFKQGGRAPFALHFATWCLTAFVFQFYTPVGIYKDLI